MAELDVDNAAPIVEAATVRAHLPPADKVEPPGIPPWERSVILLDDVPSVLRHLYGLRVAKTTVRRWCVEGLPSSRTRELPASDRKWVVLPTVTIVSRKAVRRADLLAFIEST